MNGVDNIINKIITDATEQAEEITLSAQKKADNLYCDTQKKVNDYKNELDSQLANYKSEYEKRMNTVAELDIKKQLLGIKKEQLNKVLVSAKEKLLGMPKIDYLKIIEKMISSNANDGDEVIISKQDKDVITESFISKVGSNIKKKITLSNNYGDFTGGIILSSANVDKNLTFDVELKAIFEEKETEISKILFGE